MWIGLTRRDGVSPVVLNHFIFSMWCCCHRFLHSMSKSKPASSRKPSERNPSIQRNLPFEWILRLKKNKNIGWYKVINHTDKILCFFVFVLVPLIFEHVLCCRWTYIFFFIIEKNFTSLLMFNCKFVTTYHFETEIWNRNWCTSVCVAPQIYNIYIHSNIIRWYMWHEVY